MDGWMDGWMQKVAPMREWRKGGERSECRKKGEKS